MSEIRLDKVYIPKVKKTNEGYLKGEAVVTRTGVFEYKNLDGSSRFELRHPDDVLNLDSLETLKNIPITNDHPKELVNIENTSVLMVGLTGETIKVNDNHVIAPITITHKNAINEINKGKVELSMGYHLDVEEEKGEYEGVKYTHRQKNIKYNHLAIVEVARAGRSARLNLDGALIQCDNSINNKGLTMDKEEINSRIDKLEKDIEKKELEEVKKDMQNRLDNAQVIIDQLRAENEKLKTSRNDGIFEANKRINLLMKAGKVINTDGLMEKTNREIMEEVIRNRFVNLDLADKSDEYIQGRFDAIIDSEGNVEPIKTQMLNVVSRGDSKPEVSNVELLKNIQKERMKGRV